MSAPAPTRPLTVLITGASSGIGLALARCAAHDGHPLVLVARREDRLQALAAELRAAHGVRVDVLGADLAAPGAAEALARTLRSKRRSIGILVNNAGVLEQGAFSAMPAATHDSMIALNVVAPTALIAAFLPAMLERGQGRILNVASIAALHPVPGLATYAASKAFVLSLTESLAEELRDRGVAVTALCPGITATAMLDSAATHNAKLAELPGFLVGDVDVVADAGWRACMAGETVVVPGVVNQAMAAAAGATPRWLSRRVSGVIGRKAI
jgi:hypothetical protein